MKWIVTLIVAAAAAFIATAALAKHHRTGAADPPSLGADCGTGASFVGTDTALRITTGSDFNGICTVSFSAAANRICPGAMNETNGGVDGNPAPMGCKQIDTSTIQLNSHFAVAGGDVLTVAIETYP